jgi:hypothetical protein
MKKERGWIFPLNISTLTTLSPGYFKVAVRGATAAFTGSLYVAHRIVIVKNHPEDPLSFP